MALAVATRHAPINTDNATNTVDAASQLTTEPSELMLRCAGLPASRPARVALLEQRLRLAPGTLSGREAGASHAAEAWKARVRVDMEAVRAQLRELEDFVALKAKPDSRQEVK